MSRLLDWMIDLGALWSYWEEASFNRPSASVAPGAGAGPGP